jgi:hypothetical protein
LIPFDSIDFYRYWCGYRKPNIVTHAFYIFDSDFIADIDGIANGYKHVERQENPLLFLFG